MIFLPVLNVLDDLLVVQLSEAANVSYCDKFYY